MTPENDELVRLGARLKKLSEAYERYCSIRLDTRNVDPTRSTYFESAEMDRDYEMAAVRDSLAFVKARSMAGAAIQVLELIKRFDILIDDVPSERRDFQFNRTHNGATRLLFSVADFLLDEAGETAEELGGGELDTRNLNPWLTPEERLKIVAEANETN